MLLKRNFLLCLHADTNSLRLFKVAILGLQIIKFSPINTNYIYLKHIYKD
jgi:hypothetical protein